MENTMLIEVTDKKALGLLHELEQLHLIKVLEQNLTPERPRLSEKYRGKISKERGQELKEHVRQMRNELNGI